jgi:Family of unknown function (DUF6476)
MIESKHEARATGTDGEPLPTQFSDAQMRMLKFAVTGMGVLLIAGTIALIARIAYLARSGGASGANAVSGQPQKLAAESRILLPAGAVLKSSTLSGDRLVVAFSDASGDGIIIADLTTGQVISRVKIERGP